MSTSEVEVARYFPRARRIPTMVGKLTDGYVIPGGPYTLPQITAVAATAATLWATRGWWANGGILSNFLIVVLAIGGTAFLAGQIPVTQQNPVRTGLTATRAVTAHRRGKVGARPAPAAHTTRVRRRVTIVADDTAADLVAQEQLAPASDSETSTVEVPLPVSELSTAPPAPSVPSTGLERLLAQTQGRA